MQHGPLAKKKVETPLVLDDRFLIYGTIALSATSLIASLVALLLCVGYLVFIRINLLGMAFHAFVVACVGLAGLSIASVVVSAKKLSYILIPAGCLCLWMSGLWLYSHLGSLAYTELSEFSLEPSGLALGFENRAEVLLKNLYSAGSCTQISTCADMRTFMLITFWMREAGSDKVTKCYGDKAQEVLGNILTQVKRQVTRKFKDSKKKDDFAADQENTNSNFCALHIPMFKTLGFVYNSFSWLVFDFLFLCLLHVSLIGLKFMHSKKPKFTLEPN